VRDALITGIVIGAAGGFFAGREYVLRRLGAAAVRTYRASIRRRGK
jgi:hypothetical protein